MYMRFGIENSRKFKIKTQTRLCHHISRKLDESESGQMVLEKVKWAYSYVYHHTHTKIPWQGQVQWFLEDSAIHAMFRVFLRHKMHFIMNKFSVEYFSILSKLFCNLSRYHDFDWQAFAKKAASKKGCLSQLILGAKLCH